VWHDSFICVTWLIHIWVTWHIHMCDITHSYVRYDALICATWLIHMCDMTHLYVRDDSFICVTWLIHMCDRELFTCKKLMEMIERWQWVMPSICAWVISPISTCVVSRMWMSHVPHIYMRWVTHVRKSCPQRERVTAAHYNTPQCTATHCNTLQRTATQCAWVVSRMRKSRGTHLGISQVAHVKNTFNFAHM